MKLGDLLSEDVIFTDFTAKDRLHALGSLVDSLTKIDRLRSDQRKSAYAALAERENVSTTGLGQGIAVPHATVDGLSQVTAALAISKEGVPFAAPDGLPATILFLLLVPRNSIQIHIRTLSGIARLLHSDEMRAALRAAASPQEVLQIIRTEEARG